MLINTRGRRQYSHRGINSDVRRPLIIKCLAVLTLSSVDCDTRVPVDCLLYGALEMHESPEVAILQHGSGVMQVVHNMFENGSK